jgi:signal transduction histidine kinase
MAKPAFAQLYVPHPAAEPPPGISVRHRRCLGNGDIGGLGSSTVHGVITDIGGTIKVDSSEGHGTTFRIYLPAALDPAG